MKHCMKSVQIQSFFWSAFSCIQTEYKKIRTRKYSVFGHFSRTEKLQVSLNCQYKWRWWNWNRKLCNRNSNHGKLWGAKIFQIKLARWSLIKIIFPQEGSSTLKSIYFGCRSQILFWSTITLGYKNSLAECGGYINTCQGGGTFLRENNFNQTSLR